MKRTDKELKQKLRGLKMLKEALDTLRWSALPVEDMGYIVGEKMFVSMGHQVITEALTPKEVSTEEIENAKTEKG
jgi:hypothetical protein